MESNVTVTIRRPIRDVFDFLADGTNNPQWQPRVVDTSKKTDGPVGEGTVFDQSTRVVPGLSVPTGYKITAYEEPTLLTTVVASGGPMRPEIGYRLREVDATTTEVTCSVSYAFGGVLRLAAPLSVALKPRFDHQAGAIRKAAEVLGA